MCSCRAPAARGSATISLALALSLSAASEPSVKFTDTKLKNGLRVIISEDHVAPVVAVAVVYNVGSRDERQGRTGFAHLFEHMMFQGLGERRRRRALLHGLQQRRHDERHDQRRADGLL